MTRKRQHLAHSHNQHARPDEQMGLLHMPKRGRNTSYAYEHGYVNPAKSSLRAALKRVANRKRRQHGRHVIARGDE